MPTIESSDKIPVKYSKKVLMEFVGMNRFNFPTYAKDAPCKTGQPAIFAYVQNRKLPRSLMARNEVKNIFRYKKKHSKNQKVCMLHLPVSSSIFAFYSPSFPQSATIPGQSGWAPKNWRIRGGTFKSGPPAAPAALWSQFGVQRQHRQKQQLLPPFHFCFLPLAQTQQSGILQFATKFYPFYFCLNFTRRMFYYFILISSDSSFDAPSHDIL